MLDIVKMTVLPFQIVKIANGSKKYYFISLHSSPYAGLSDFYSFITVISLGRKFSIEMSEHVCIRNFYIQLLITFGYIKARLLPKVCTGRRGVQLIEQTKYDADFSRLVNVENWSRNFYDTDIGVFHVFHVNIILTLTWNT